VLVIHGDKDYRVPIGEGLALWWELCSRARTRDHAAPASSTSRTRTTGCWRPQHAKLWYETVSAFLAVHVRGQQWVVPDLLQ
jgi:dipeptidyl aminopeptidase/acylaminoacyl peptidase